MRNRLDVFALVIAAFLAFGSVDPLAALAQRSLPTPPAVVRDTSYGTVPYDLDMLALDGSPRSLAEFRDRVLFINFWATWCSPCRAELPSIEALAQRVSDAPVEVLLISTDDDAAEVRRFLEEQGIAGQVFLRQWGAGESPFRRVVIPTTYVISRSGEITYQHSGAVDWDDESMALYLLELAEQ